MSEPLGRRKSLGLYLFKSKSKERKGSVDSTYSSNGSDTSEVRSEKSSVLKKFRKGSAPNPLPPNSKAQAFFLPTNKDLQDQEKKKLRKNQQEDFPTIDVSQAYQRNAQTGEQVIDHTDLLHSLVHHGSSDSLQQLYHRLDKNALAVSGEEVLAKLPMNVWERVFGYLPLADAVSIALSCKAVRRELPHIESEINLPENKEDRIHFLLRLDGRLPNHLFCFNCTIYHRRINPGNETLQKTNIANPVFNCPVSSHPTKRVSRVRITSGRALPYTFNQLIFRYEKSGPLFGIHVDKFSRRYKDANVNLNNGAMWSHQTRFCIVNGHLLMRVISSTFAAPGLPPAGLRNLLYNPSEEFHPYFSTCPHWRDGLLMPLVKCALGHIPVPITGGGVERVGQEIKSRLSHHNPIVTLCSECRPMRRCPQCPTEYLIEIKMTEDKSEIDPRKTFKQALSVTRWSDLGDGTVPFPSDTLVWSKEWAAQTGQIDDFDSFAVLGRRGISGVFESQYNVDLIPGQQILNLNVEKVRLGEKGHDWY